MTVEGVRLHYVVRGTGRPVVFLHGNNGTLVEFALTGLEPLAARYRVVAFDRPGYGYSERPTGFPATPPGQVRLLHGALAALRLRHPVLVSHAWSTGLALAYALSYPGELAGLILTAPITVSDPAGSGAALKRAPYLIDLAGWLSGLWAPGQTERALTETFAPAPVPPAVQAAARRLWERPAQLRASLQDEAMLGPWLSALRPDWGRITTPTVILAGGSDQLALPARHAEPLAKALPRALYTVVPDAGHGLPYSHPEALAQAVRWVLAVPPDYLDLQPGGVTPGR